MQSHVCEVGREKDETNTWILPYQDPCLCAKVMIGGVNTLAPIRPFIPIKVYRPLISDDLNLIREHYNVTAEEKGMVVLFSLLFKSYSQVLFIYLFIYLFICLFISYFAS